MRVRAALIDRLFVVFFIAIEGSPFFVVLMHLNVVRNAVVNSKSKKESANGPFGHERAMFFCPVGCF